MVSDWIIMLIKDDFSRKIENIFFICPNLFRRVKIYWDLLGGVAVISEVGEEGRGGQNHFFLKIGIFECNKFHRM